MSSIEKAIARLSGVAEQQSRKESPKPTLKPVGSKTEDGNSVPREHAPNRHQPLELDLKKLARTGLLTPQSVQSQLAEEYRLLKHLLSVKPSGLETKPEECLNLIAITSALKGEGKTFNAFNLTMSIAMERDTKVLLVDGDLIGQSLTHMVGLDNAHGLADVLSSHDANLEHIILSTNIPKFSLIPAGRPHDQATELLASERMRALAFELATRYNDRIVLFDTPPLLASSSALILASLVGQVLVIVEEGKTRSGTIKEALSLLDEQKSIGMVLNKCIRKPKNRYY